MIVLASYWPNVHPSLARLSQDMGLSRGQTAEWLKRIEARGLIVTQRRGAGQTAVRVLNLPALDDAR